MQPTYLPWIGYMALMDSVDAFVFLDSVQFERRSWQQRNRIKTAAGELMLTVPVHKKGRRDQTIAEVEINLDGDPLEKHARAIAMAYAKAPFISTVGGEISAVLSSRPSRLVDLDLALIELMRGVLQIETPCLRSSTLAATGQKADLLAAICAELNATRYLSPPGSRGYLDESDAMKKAGIAVDYFSYVCVPYQQLHGDFLPYLSAIDLLLNHGPHGAEVMRAGLQPQRQAIEQG